MQPTQADSTLRPRDPPTLVWSAVAAIGVAFLGASGLPLLIGNLMEELGLDEVRVGWLGSFELGAMAAASLLLAPRLDVLSRGRVATVAGLLAATGHLAAIWAPDFGTLAGSRLLAGLGEGGVLAAANAGIASSTDPDRLYAKVAVAGGLLGAGLLAFLPLPMESWGRAGSFGTLTILSLGLLPFVAWLPNATSAGSRDAGRGRPLVSNGGTSMLTGCALVAIADGAIWTFAGRIGTRTGLSTAAVGSALAGTTIAGIFASALAAWMGSRYGRTRPVTLGGLALGVSLWVVAGCETPTPFVVALVGYALAYFWLNPYLLGTAAAVDPTGRLPAATSGATLVGNAVGPALAGSLVSVGGYPSLGWLGLILSMLLIGFVAPVALRTERRVLDVPSP